MTQVNLEELIAGAKDGKLVSFPTDTVPALAVRPDRANLIFEAKQRRQDKPLILMGASMTDLLPYVVGTATELEVWQQVAQRYFPGALTLVLPASEKVPKQMNPLDATTIGIRVPDSAIAQTILSHQPLATTSANRSGEPALQTMAEIEAQFPEVLTLATDIEAVATGVPSTVAKWTGEGWEILRLGSIKLTKDCSSTL